MTTNQSTFKSRGGVMRLFRALRYSAQGLCAALRHEAAFRQELAFFVVLCPVAIWLGRSATEIFFLIGSMVLVLIVELINSALEAIADAVTLEHHPLIGRAKDLGSAAVLLAIMFSVVAWLWVIVSVLSAGPAG
ncbi:MAG TPA: diacylglycerol kinase [Burkholderiaceae bacterium]|nr:diacylglycerol kinase [Burkholderiaceae bacterium]